MTIAGIIFDKDGTLFDFNKTWGVVTKALIEVECAGDVDKMRELAQVLGFDMGHSVFLPGSLVIAETSDVVAEAILPFSLDQDIDALSTRMKAATSNVRQVEVADLQSLFKDLRQRGLKLGIATNDSEEPARANIAQAGVLDAFDFIAGFDSGFGAKPEIGQLRAFCDQQNLMPDQCVMVGDSLHDLHAGRRAGMRTIGVLTGPASREDLTPHADIVLDTIADIPAWLDEQ
jgi:phosphoglycolate phosphatase